MSTYIGFNLNSNRQIEHFQTIENRYGINSDGGKFLFGQAELALKGSYIPKEEVYLIPYQGAVQPGNIGKHSINSPFHSKKCDITFVIKVKKLNCYVTSMDHGRF